MIRTIIITNEQPLGLRGDAVLCSPYCPALYRLRADQRLVVADDVERTDDFKQWLDDLRGEGWA